MIDEPASAPITDGPICPWCSAPLATADVEHCPNCGAAMTAEQEPVIPGVTTIEPEILARQARLPKPRRSGLMSLFVKDENAPVNVEQPTLAELPALARPSLEVRREMIRIELENAGVLPAGEAEGQAGEAEGSPGEAEGSPGEAKGQVESQSATDDSKAANGAAPPPQSGGEPAQAQAGASPVDPAS